MYSMHIYIFTSLSTVLSSMTYSISLATISYSIVSTHSGGIESYEVAISSE